MRFYFHYNKPQSKKRKRVVWSVHVGGVCHLVDRIVCCVPVQSHVRKRQPVAIIRGYTNTFRVKSNTAYIY